MGMERCIFLLFLLIYSLRVCQSQISEEYYYGSIENETVVGKDTSISPTPKSRNLQQQDREHSAEWQDSPKPLPASKFERKLFFRKKANSTRLPLNATRKDGRRYKYNPHYKDGVAAKSGLEFYEWTYTKETFHADINNLNEYEDHDQLSDEAKAVILKDYWDSELIPGERNSFTQRIEMEKKQGIKHYGTQKQQIYACFYILTTFQNAIDDLRDYYRLRYLYVNNLEYEVGYLVQEIVYKYSVVLELFHLMQEKYYKQTEHKTIVPSSYMFYIYTHILQQSKQIIHLCNMAHELENKYKNAPLTVFKDYADREGLIENDDGTSNRGDGRSKYLASLAGNSTEEKRNKHAMDMLALHRENERIRQRKEAHENHKNLLKYGTYKTTERTRRPQTYGNFPRIYGWSIEYW